MGARLHALELIPDATGDAAIRLDWHALQEAGLPSMLDHVGSTNAPHVTVIAVPTIGAVDEQRAADLIGPLLPVTARTSGLVLLGGERLTVARALEVPDQLVRAVLDLRAATAGHQHESWLPHVSVAPRVRRSDLATVIEALEPAGLELQLSSLRRWDPDLNEVRVVAG